MIKIETLREISLIHAVKCGKTQLDSVAINSFNTLNEIKRMIETDIDSNLIIEQISNWKNQEPIVTNNEILSLFKNK